MTIDIENVGKLEVVQLRDAREMGRRFDDHFVQTIAGKDIDRHQLRIGRPCWLDRCQRRKLIRHNADLPTRTICRTSRRPQRQHFTGGGLLAPFAKRTVGLIGRDVLDHHFLRPRPRLAARITH